MATPRSSVDALTRPAARAPRAERCVSAAGRKGSIGHSRRGRARGRQRRRVSCSVPSLEPLGRAPHRFVNSTHSVPPYPRCSEQGEPAPPLPVRLAQRFAGPAHAARIASVGLTPPESYRDEQFEPWIDCRGAVWGTGDAAAEATGASVRRCRACRRCRSKSRHTSQTTCVLTGRRCQSRSP